MDVSSSLVLVGERQQREEARALFEQMKQLSPEQRKELRENWRRMTPEQRRAWVEKNAPKGQ